MADWSGLTVDEQEKVSGSTYLDDIECDDAVKPSNSHVALYVSEDGEGNELQSLRRSMPFVELDKCECGTYYIA